MLAAMDQTPKPLRWRIADLLDGRAGRRAIRIAGALTAVIVVLLMMFRSYEGRPLKIAPSGIVEQTAIQCPPARTALTASFNKAEIVQDQIRVCVETGRAKAFVTGLALLFIGIAAVGLSRLPAVASRRSPAEATAWDRAIARARRVSEKPDERAG